MILLLPDRFFGGTDTGRHRLSVTVDWAATVTIPGLPPVQLPGTIARTSAPVPIQVRQARAQLESG